jgi:transcriptional regulator with XRE-family HTH domain
VAYWRFDPSRLRAARIEKGWSLAQLARGAGLRPPALSAIETHQRPCRERSARAISAALRVPLEDLAAPYTAADRPIPRQLAVETFPSAEDFKQLEHNCRLSATLAFGYSESRGARYEDDAVAWADAAVLVYAFADTREQGAQVDLVDFEALLEYHGDQSHYAVSTLTPERRSRLVEALESINRDMGPLLTQPPGIRAAAIAVADWLRT